MDISIIILTKNAGEGFTTLLQRISSQKFDGNYEIVVLDSGSTDSTLEIAHSFPTKITRIEPREFHHGRTRNLGAELASGRILVYITQDALPLYDSWLQKLTEDLDDPRVAMVVGRQIPWPDTKPPEKFFYSYYFPEHKIEVVSGASGYYRDNMFISNVNSAIKRDVWQQFKFSEKVILAEDKEFARRVLLAGWKIVYRPDAVVYHAHDFSLRSIFRRSMDSGIALAQGVNVPRSRNWVISRLWYFVKEAGYIVANRGWWKWLPYSV
ncbi:MAG: glycosyltransferase, partial [Chloroflexi bacterium]|nr:glycosyltransferase [Chloroflexota bacterium]